MERKGDALEKRWYVTIKPRGVATSTALEYSTVGNTVDESTYLWTTRTAGRTTGRNDLKQMAALTWWWNVYVVSVPWSSNVSTFNHRFVLRRETTCCRRLFPAPLTLFHCLFLVLPMSYSSWSNLRLLLSNNPLETASTTYHDDYRVITINNNAVLAVMIVVCWLGLRVSLLRRNGSRCDC